MVDAPVTADGRAAAGLQEGGIGQSLGGCGQILVGEAAGCG